jgi:hypothetical protein
MGCNTADTDTLNSNGNLIAESRNRGVDFVMGFSEEIYPTHSGYWSDAFWSYLAGQSDLDDAAYWASEDTYFEKGGYGGMNYYVIRDDGSLLIYPPSGWEE